MKTPTVGLPFLRGDSCNATSIWCEKVKSRRICCPRDPFEDLPSKNVEGFNPTRVFLLRDGKVEFSSRKKMEVHHSGGRRGSKKSNFIWGGGNRLYLIPGRGGP